MRSRRGTLALRRGRNLQPLQHQRQFVRSCESRSIRLRRSRQSHYAQSGGWAGHSRLWHPGWWHALVSFPLNSSARFYQLRAYGPSRPGTVRQQRWGNPAGDQTWLLNARTIEFRVDHSFTPNFRMSESFYWVTGPRSAIAAKSQVARRNLVEKLRPKRTPVITETVSISASQLTTRIPNSIGSSVPNLFNHTTIAWDRWFIGREPAFCRRGLAGILWAGTPGAANPLGN